MKIRVEISSIEIMSKDTKNYFLRMKGMTADLPGRPILALSGPYTREAAEKLNASIEGSVAPGIPLAEAGLVCEISGAYITSPPVKDEPENLVKLIATSFTVLQSAELVLYRQFKRFLGTLKNIMDIPGVPKAVIHELEGFALSSGWNPEFLQTQEFDDLSSARPAEDSVIVAPAPRGIEEAAAPAVGVHSSLVDAAPSTSLKEGVVAPLETVPEPDQAAEIIADKADIASETHQTDDVPEVQMAEVHTVVGPEVAVVVEAETPVTSSEPEISNSEAVIATTDSEDNSSHPVEQIQTVDSEPVNNVVVPTLPQEPPTPQVAAVPEPVAQVVSPPRPGMIARFGGRPMMPVAGKVLTPPSALPVQAAPSTHVVPNPPIDIADTTDVKTPAEEIKAKPVEAPKSPYSAKAPTIISTGGFSRSPFGRPGPR
jgi:hypothetical protein